MSVYSSSLGFIMVPQMEVSFNLHGPLISMVYLFVGWFVKQIVCIWLQIISQSYGVYSFIYLSKYVKFSYVSSEGSVHKGIFREESDIHLHSLFPSYQFLTTSYRWPLSLVSGLFLSFFFFFLQWVSKWIFSYFAFIVTRHFKFIIPQCTYLSSWTSSMFLWIAA